MKKTEIREYIEWSNLRWNDATTPGKPRVLLIGDSIVVGHGEEFFKLVKDHHAVDYLATSKCVSDTDYRFELDYMLNRHKYNVIVFNNTLHGFDIDDEIYQEALRETLLYLKNQTPKLYWRTGTPMLEPGDHSQIHAKHGDRVARRNILAAQAAQEFGIPVIEFYRPMLRNRILFAEDGTHYNEAGRKKQAELLLTALKSDLALA